MGLIYSKRDVRRAGGCSARPTLSWSDCSEDTTSVQESGVTSNASETVFLYSPIKGCSSDDSGKMKRAACGNSITQQQQQQQQETGKVSKWRRCMKLIGDRCGSQWRGSSGHGDSCVEYQPIGDNKDTNRAPADAALGRSGNYGEVTLGHIYDEIAAERRRPTWLDKSAGDEEARRAYELQQLRLLITKMHRKVTMKRPDRERKRTRNRFYAAELESREAHYRYYVRRYQQLRQVSLTVEDRRTAEEDEKRVLAELVRINMTANNIYVPSTCRCSYHDQQRLQRDRHDAPHLPRRRSARQPAAEASNVEELPARQRHRRRYVEASAADVDAAAFGCGVEASDSDDDDEGSTSLDDSGIGESPVAPGQAAVVAGKSTRRDAAAVNEIRRVSGDELLTGPPPRTSCVSSSHFWYRHRHREENERRAMDRVVEWISRQTARAEDGCGEVETGRRNGVERVERRRTEQRQLGHSSHRHDRLYQLK